jgi:nitrite reductase/ring-hydroxylating ferredoxin subunit
MAKLSICKLDELAENGARGFCLPYVTGELELCVVRNKGEVFAYINSCPHTGLPLNWLPDQFLDNTGNYLQCSNHFALFEIDSGRCVQGPCTGQYLQRWPVTQEGDELFVEVAQAS